jgi:hypothetical protein
MPRLAAWVLRLGLPLFPAFLAFFQVLNRDIGFHVATGRAIRLLGEVPRTNVLSFAQPFQPWILHQWLPATLFERLDAAWGPSALVWCKVGVIYLTFLFVWLALERTAASKLSALLWFVLAASASACRFYVRPYIFSMLGLSLLLFILGSLASRRHLTLGSPASRRHPTLGSLASRRHLAMAGLLAGIFAALHAGVIYLLLVLLALVGGAFGAALMRPRSPEARPQLTAATSGLAVALITAAAVAWLESPWGVKALLLPFQFSSSEYFHQHLVEYRPPAFDLAVYPFFWTLVIASAVIGVFRTVLLVRRLKEQTYPELALYLFRLFLLGGFTLLALKHQRIVFPYALVAAFVLAGWTAVCLRHLSAAGVPARLRQGALLAATVAIAVGAVHLQFTNARFGTGVDQRYHPGKLFDFVEQQGLPPEAYVSDSWGGAWLWRFYPHRKVFYDNRLEAYSFDFYRGTYQAIRYGEKGWQEMLDRYAINTLALRYSTPGERRFQQGKPNIRDLAFESPQWSLVYWDEVGQLFVRPGLLPLCVEQRGCQEWRHFNPDTLMPARGSTQAEVELELQAVWSLQPNPLACYALARLLAADGRWDRAVPLLKEGLERFDDNPMLLQLAASFGGAGR